jgi:hypothetical protein
MKSCWCSVTPIDISFIPVFAKVSCRRICLNVLGLISSVLSRGAKLQVFFSRGVAQFGLIGENQVRHSSEKLMGVLDHINNSGKGKFFAGQGAQ